MAQKTEKKLNTARIQHFKKTLARFEKEYGLRDFPWRKTVDPYYIFISELMLQQTQAPRVVPKYEAFITAFPTVHALADASTDTVLSHWNGLGYNRRALFAKQCAQTVLRERRGIFPKTVSELESLPGIGPYTARAIAAFAYNQPVVLVEANVRTIFIHHFFNRAKRKIPDVDLLPYIEKTLDRKNPRHWYNLLMDYGTYLKKEGIVAHRASKQYVKQSPLRGSLREVRGRVVKSLLKAPKTLEELAAETAFSEKRLLEALFDLQKEGFVERKSESFSLAKT